MKVGVFCKSAGKLVPKRAALLRDVEATSTRFAASSGATVLPHRAESYHSKGRIHCTSIVLWPITDIAGRHARAWPERMDAAVEPFGDYADRATLEQASVGFQMLPNVSR